MTTNNERREIIYGRLRGHPKGSREVARLANHMPTGNRIEAVKMAQKITVDFVEEIYRGDANRFLNDYENGHIGPLDLLAYTGKKELGLI